MTNVKTHSDDEKNSNVTKDNIYLTKTSCIQIGYGIWVNLNVVNVGYAFGFGAVVAPQLKRHLEYEVSVAELSWIASVIMLTAPVGCVANGLMMDTLGRKLCLVVSELLLCIAWCYIAFVKSINDLVIGRALVGLGVGFVMGCPRVYITEITLPHMRGVLGATISSAMALGITIEAILGMYFNWRILCYFHVCYCFVLAISNCFIPESPYYVLMTHPDPEKMTALLKKFRSKNFAVNQEISDLMDYKQCLNIRRLSWKEKMHALIMPYAYKPFLIVISLIAIGQLSGITVLQFYAVEILQSSKSAVDAHVGNILLGVTRLFSSILASILLGYKVGRKTLAYISFIGVGITAITIGMIIVGIEKKNVFPQIGYIFYVVFASLGHYFLSAIIMAEIYPLQIRGLLGGITSCLQYLIIFAVSMLFPYTKDKFGLHTALIFFGSISLLGIAFIYFFLPETRNLTLVEIEEYFRGVRPSLRSDIEIMQAQSRKELFSILKSHSRSLHRHDQVIVNKNPSKVRLNLSKEKVLSVIQRESDDEKSDADIEQKSNDQLNLRNKDSVITIKEPKDLKKDRDKKLGSSNKEKQESEKEQREIQKEEDRSGTQGTSKSDDENKSKDTELEDGTRKEPKEDNGSQIPGTSKSGDKNK